MIVAIFAQSGEVGCSIVLESEPELVNTGTPAASYSMSESVSTVYESANITGLSGEFRVRLRNGAGEPMYTGYVLFDGGARGQAYQRESTINTAVAPTTPETIAGTVADLMATAGSISIDGVSVTERSISEMIAGERYQAANSNAAQSAPYGIRFSKLRPGSAR